MKRWSFGLIAVAVLLCLVGWTSYGQKQAESKPPAKWEYMSMTVADYQGAGPLNNAGAQGWELVAVTQPEGANTTKQYFFKRVK